MSADLLKCAQTDSNIPVCSFRIGWHVTVIIEQVPLLMSADVLNSAGAGRVADEGLVAICPQRPCFVFSCPVAG